MKVMANLYSFPSGENKLRLFYNIPCASSSTLLRNLPPPMKKETNASKDNFKTGPYMYSWGSVSCHNLLDYLLK